MNWDEKLNIQTEGLDESHADYHHFRYEPTPYQVLERILDTGLITEKNHLMDMGCGKGRVSFFLSMFTGCKSTGVDFDSNLIELANQNNLHFSKSELVNFVCQNAESVELSDEDVFYFFNPFSEKILRSVMSRIIESYYVNPRNIRLFFYYPSHDVLAYLTSVNELVFYDEIDCEDFYEQEDKRERVMIFEII
ncbi:MAG: class I SAM-dependent methyltransferase [Erysipelotrichaceae bacterium]|nr:class I SAM-dependent methyltransferase [Erysipelotrichaceae bacterium]